MWWLLGLRRGAGWSDTKASRSARAYCRVGVQRSRCVGIPRQQAVSSCARSLQLEHFVHIQRRSVAHYIAHRSPNAWLPSSANAGAGCGGPTYRLVPARRGGWVLSGWVTAWVAPRAWQRWSGIMGERGNHHRVGDRQAWLVELGAIVACKALMAALPSCVRASDGNLSKGLEAKIPRSAQNQPGDVKRLFADKVLLGVNAIPGSCWLLNVVGRFQLHSGFIMLKNCDQ